MRSAGRQLWPWLAMAGALAVMSGLLFSRFLNKRQEGLTQVSSELEAELGDRVGTWEEQIVEQLDSALATMARQPRDAWDTEQRLRRHEAWLDSIYLWRPWREVVVSGRRTPMPGRFLYPTRPPSENKDYIYSRSCMLRARMLTMAPGIRAARIAAAYVEGCSNQSVSVRMVAGTEAAVHLQRAGQHVAALAALDSSGVDTERSLRDILHQGLDPWRYVVQRTHRAELLLALDRPAEALDLLYQTGREITALPAPVMEQGRLLPYVAWPVIARLREAGRDAQVRELKAALSKAERRVLGWREIQDRILPRPPPAASDPGRFIYDQYNRTPFLLYYHGRWGDTPIDSAVGVGVQLDQPALLQELLRTLRIYRDHLVITDQSGRFVAGARSGGPIALSIPFTATLTHLRVGLRQEAVDARMERFDDQLILLLILAAACVALVFVLLAALYRANKQLKRLLERQRNFTTRITHELKTPLAGVRVMAENLTAGAYRDHDHLREIAERIVDETDRLTRRVDEILAVTRQRRVPDPEPFDPEEALLEAIDTWGPRYEQSGMVMHADLHPTDEIVGDHAAVRDAVGCLLDNALKYRRRDIDNPQVWLTLTQQGERVRVEVLDNGMGVPPHKREEIFERFTRVEGPNRGLAGGHGLGLSQVAEVARRHDGRVSCTEGIDGGSRFVLELSTG